MPVLAVEKSYLSSGCLESIDSGSRLSAPYWALNHVTSADLCEIATDEKIQAACPNSGDEKARKSVLSLKVTAVAVERGS